MMLCEANIDFHWAWIGWILVGFGALCAIINQIDDFLDRRKTKPGEPPNEQLEQAQRTLATRVDRLEITVEKVREEIRQNHESAKRDGSIRSKTLFDALNTTRHEVTQHIESVRKELSDSQRSLPNEIVALLRNTNAIK